MVSLFKRIDKRRLRAIVREIVPSLPNNYNVVFIAKSGIENLTFKELKDQVDILILKMDLQ